MKAFRRLGEALAATLLLLAPAMWNGFPFLQYDSGGYVARFRGLSGAEPLDGLRPVRRRRMAARFLAGGACSGGGGGLDPMAGAAGPMRG